MKKSDIYKESGANLASKVPDSVAKEFRRQAKETPGQNVKTCLAAAAHLWISLPPKLQREILANLDANPYQTLTNWIRDEQVEKYLSGLSSKEKARILAFAKETKAK